jgi:hypothetical protein
MPPPSDLLLLSTADRIAAALKAMKSDASLSQRHAAAIYNVGQSTLSEQRAGTTLQCDICPNCSLLTKLEEEVLVQQIRKLDK